MNASNQIGTCTLCERENVSTTVHHLTPKSRGGKDKETAHLCVPCHKQLHALFTNRELAESLSTIEQLRAQEQVARYLRWIRKQPPTVVPRVRKSKSLLDQL